MHHAQEVVLNLMTLRFANQIFEPIWNSQHIESVEITFKEDLGTGGRGGYFDGFGIIRDIMQNHLLQVFMFVAIEPPAGDGGAAELQAAKVQLLKETATLNYTADDVFLGQFGASCWNEGGATHTEPGYLDDPTVPEGSRCPTFAAVQLRVNNERWDGVPFVMKAGKGLDERMAEVRVRFKPQGYNRLMAQGMGPGQTLEGNELVMRIQPDEALYFKTYSKQPGLGQVVKPTVMDMKYATQFQGAYVGDAYERMFLNAALGDGSLFVSAGELVEAWRIFTPLLHQIDEQKPPVVLYPFGSRYPPGFESWSASRGVPQSLNWQQYIGEATTEALTALFKELDVDGSGALTAEQVTSLASRFYDGRAPTRKKVSQIISRMDTAADGVVSLPEILEAHSKFHNAFGLGEGCF
jgi:glucose-6-phosphate 1-dehydrogenase